MKKRTFLKSAVSFALTVVLLLAMALPALAADITIEPNGQAKIGGAQRFTAYQIFKGEVGKAPGELDGLDWGEGVEPTALVQAMQGSDLLLESGTTFGKAFADAYAKYDEVHDGVSQAEFVAQWLGAHIANTSYADDFARIVAGNIKGAGTTSAFNIGETAWVISNLDPGYYLVVDNYKSSGGDVPDGSVSSYILQVLGTETVELKATIPTVEKKVEGQDGYLTGIDNQAVHFTLTGTVAENIAEYSTYKYEFVDTLSAGLTMDTPISDDNLNVKLGEHLFARGNDYTVTYENGAAGGHVLTITFKDLKKVCADAKVSLNKDSKIVVSYTARLTKDAVVTTAGNPNDVILKYSNDPYKAGEGETAHDEVKTYTIALNIVKQGTDHTALEDVGFKLMKDSRYAKLEKGSDGTYWSITGWDADGTEIRTDSGGKFCIHGLDEGKYSLVETSVPEGYEKMKDIVFNIAATVDGNGDLTDVTLTRDAAHAKRTDVAFSGVMKDGSGTLTLTNFKSPILPHTGGTGAGVIYIVSALAVLVGAAIVFAAVRKRGGGRHKAGRR